MQNAMTGSMLQPNCFIRLGVGVLLAGSTCASYVMIALCFGIVCDRVCIIWDMEFWGLLLCFSALHQIECQDISSALLAGMQRLQRTFQLTPACIQCFECYWSAAQVDADPSNGKRAALRSEDEIARLIGRSNIVSKVAFPPFL